jgi:hypothetical protein
MLMKKALLIGLVLGLAAVWTAPAMAVDLTATGYIGVKGYVGRNAFAPPAFFFGRHTVHYAAVGPGPSPAAAFNQQIGSFMNSRADLQFTLAASKDLFGVIKFRMDSQNFGAARTLPAPLLATVGGQTGDWGAEGGGQIGVQVQEVFIDFKIPQMPLWVRAGLQPVFIRGWTFYFEDAAGLSLRTMIDPIKLSATGYFIKLLEPSAVCASGAAELFAIDTKIPLSLGGLNVAPGVVFVWQNERLDGYDPDARDLWWIGFNLDGGMPPVGFQFDFFYNGGTEKYDNQVDIDYGSYLVNGQVSAIFKKLEVGIAGKYVRGEDFDSANDYETFQLPGTANYGSEAMAISGDFVVFDHGWMMPGPGWAGTGLIDGPSTFWFGYWDVRMFAYYQLLEWLKLGAQVGYIGDTCSGGYPGDTIGTDADDDDSIGWEFDFGFNVQIYKNLSLQTAFGYLVAHKALSQAGGVKPDDPWSLSSRLMYTF